MALAQLPLGTNWTREMRNAINSMFTELYNEYMAAGDNAEDARKKAEQAVADALIAKDTAETTREEMLAIIREQTRNGDLAPEIAQARQGYSTLGENLNSVKSQLGQTENNINSREINVKYPPSPLIGAKGDGVSDDTSAIQNIIDYVRDNGGGKILIPYGEYLITATLKIYSNIEIVGSGTPTSIIKNNRGYVFEAVGSVDEEIPIAIDRTIGDRDITTTTSHGLEVGDLVLIKSQRSGFSADASEQWRLGGATGGTNAAFYGEFIVVETVNSPTEFTASSGLIYPDYFKDRLRETDENARSSATIQKVSPVKDAKISNLSFGGNIIGGVKVIYGYNVITENLNAFVKENATVILFRESFNCRDSYSKVRFDPNFKPANHYDRNSFKVSSSQNCGFEGTYAEFGTQPFDFNFNDYSIVTTFPFVKNCRTSFSDLNPITSHGGVYGAVITNNQFLNCKQYGISTRARNSTISNNVIQGSKDGKYSYGVALYEGWARDCIVSNNQISGFNKGVTHIDGPTSDKFFDWIGTQIFGNVLKDVNRGLEFELHSENNFTGNSGVSFTNNSITSFYDQYAKAVILTRVHGVFVGFNTFRDPTNSANAGVYIVDGNNNRIINNDFGNISPHLWVEPPTIGNINVSFETNQTFYASHINVPDTNVSLSKFLLGSQNPRSDGKYSLGWSGGRWQTVYAVNGSINTSDERHKQQIESIPDEWLNAWADVNYTRFKFNDAVQEKGAKARWHIGVIAQQIYESFSRRGLDAFEIGLLCYDEWKDDETGETKTLWSIRPDECQFLEMALLRRELSRINN